MLWLYASKRDEAAPAAEEAKKREREGGARQGKMCKKEIPKAKAIIHYTLFPLFLSLISMHHATCTLHHL